MEINIKHGDVMEVALEGRLDTVTSAELQAALDKENISESLVVVDMKSLEYISSAGLRLLLALKKRLDGEKKALEIHNLNDICLEVFKVTGFINILTVK